MLVLPGEIHHLRHLRLRHLVRVDAADADAAPAYVQHNAGRLLPAFCEKPLQDVNDEFHRRVVVIQHQHLVHRGLLRLRLGLDDNARAGSFLAASSVVAHLRPSHWPSRWRCSPPHDIGFAGPRKRALRSSLPCAARNPACAGYSLRQGRLSSPSIIASMGTPRCSIPATAAAIGISISSRSASRATASAVATPSITERCRAASASVRFAPRPSATPSAWFRDCPAVQVSTKSPSPDRPRKVSASAPL